jgi:hypothetical protein
MKKFNVIVLICSLLISGQLIAQQDDKKMTEPSNAFIGGSLSLGLGNGSFNAGLHPHVGYTLAKWIDVAGVVNFEYQSQRDQFNNKYHTTVYGLGAFTRIFPVQFIFIQAQPEYNFIQQKYIPASGSSQKFKVDAPSLLLGAGYTTSRSGKNSFTYLSILFDVLKDKNSPYVDGFGNLIPIIRAGINIGLNRKQR